MGQIKVSETPIRGLYVIEPTVHGDSRGYFVETYNQNDMCEAGLDMVFVQDNQSMSTKGEASWTTFSEAISPRETGTCDSGFCV